MLRRGIMNRLLIKKQAKASLKGKWGKAVGINFVAALLVAIIPAIIYITAIGAGKVALWADNAGKTIGSIFAGIFGGASIIFLIVCIVVSIIIGPVFNYSTSKAFLRGNRGEDYSVGNVFDGFKDKPAKTVFSGVIASIIIYLCYYIPALLGGIIIAHIAPRAKHVIDTINKMDHGRLVYFTKHLGVQMFAAFVIFAIAALIGIFVTLVYSMIYYVRADDPDIGVIKALTQSRKIMHGRKFDLAVLTISFFGWFIVCCVTCGIGFLWLVPYIKACFATFYDDAKDNII